MKPNIISLAIKAAGGYEKVGAFLGVPWATVKTWVVRKTIPPHFILGVCDLSNNLINPIQVLQYITESKSGK